MANGYSLSVCSGYGFSSRRDSNGIAKRGSGWSHAMSWIACDDTRTRLNEILFLVQNSWGGGIAVQGFTTNQKEVSGSEKKTPEVCYPAVVHGFSAMLMAFLQEK